MKRVAGIVAVGLLAACVHPQPAGRRLGRIDFPVSCNPAAGERVRDGVALLHHTMYADAERSFIAAMALDERCAMAHWGIAMAQFQPLSPGYPEETALERGVRSLEKARELAPPTERERAYIEAAAAFFDEREQRSHAARIAAWEQAQDGLRRAYPQDVDAAAFYALARLASAPKDKPEPSRRLEAGESLEALWAENPEHPGAIHYLIQAYDSPPLASRAFAAAQAYERLAPGVAQALHMPSHIFVRLGRWTDAIESSTRAAAAARRTSVGGGTSHDYAHALDYLMYVYLQVGRDQRALGILRQLQRTQRFQDDFISAYALAAAPARYYLEREEWQGAARVTAAGPADFPWGKYPAARAVTQFARGIGAARSGDSAAGRTAVSELEAIHRSLAESEPYWAAWVDAQRQAVEAWVAAAEGQNDDALARMRTAAEIEASLDLSPGAPGPVLPLCELLGDLLLRLARPAEALVEFEGSLATAPNRFYSVYKAGRSAQRAGDKQKAHAHFTQLLKLAEESHIEAVHTDRAAVEKAKHFLRLNREPARPQ